LCSSNAFIGLETDADHIKPRLRSKYMQLAQNARIRADVCVSDVNNSCGEIQ
jgi:hypothetical protein